jgi:hypothetical protein
MSTPVIQTKLINEKHTGYKVTGSPDSPTSPGSRFGQRGVISLIINSIPKSVQYSKARRSRLMKKIGEKNLVTLSRQHL